MFTFVFLIGILFTNFALCTLNPNIVKIANNEHRSIKRDLLNTGIERSTTKEVCKTPECVSTAKEILKNMDKSVDPCDNFYKFACGGFLQKVNISEDKSSASQFSRLTYKLEEQLKNSIESGMKEDDIKAFKLLQIFYNSCMDTKKIEETSEQELTEILKNLGGWPVIEGETWDESSFDWKELTYNLSNTGYSTNYFICLGVSVDHINSTNHIINLDEASLGVSQMYLSKGMDEKVVQAYHTLMIDFAEMLGADRQKAEKELTEALDFEIALANISLSKEDRQNVTNLYNPMTVNELQSKYSDIPWLEYMNKIFGPNAKINLDDKVNVAVPYYFESLFQLVNKTPKRVLANYAMWRVTYVSSHSLGERASNVLSKFKASTSGISAKQVRWKECVSNAMNSMSLAASALYVRRQFDKSTKDNVVEMLHNVRQSFKKLIEQIDWMDDETRKIALDKLNYMKSFIAYPNEFLDDNKLDEYYQNLQISSESFLKNNLNINLFDRANVFDQLRKPANKSCWITHGNSAVVNAFYNPSQNSMEFPAGILQGLFFSHNRPRYLNYAAIGWSMGHEMTHAFDDKGRQYDKDGNVQNWWNSETEKQYLTRAQCIIDQYNNYTVTEVGLNLNGIVTQGENIADNGGIKEAYYAYSEWEQTNGVEAALPDLNFTSQQMFWIMAANKWCSKYTPELLRSTVVTDVHCPSEFRVIGTMSNRPEFAKDFNCPSGSYMNPVKKCSVW